MSNGPKSAEGLDRRKLLLGAAVGAAGAVGGLAIGRGPVNAATKPPRATTTSNPATRSATARIKAAELAASQGLAAQRANGDETRIPRRAACFTKGLPHVPERGGFVDAAAYDLYLAALESGEPLRFESIPLGGFARLANPQAAWSVALIGPDPAQVACPPAPLFDSDEQAAEIVELYWQALLRDVPFAEYETHPLAQKAAEELTQLSDFRGPKSGPSVTARTLFRGPSAGDLVGPYLSQFLLKPIPMVPTIIEQRIRTATPAKDFLYEFEAWRAIQNGGLAGVNTFDPQARFQRNGRDLGEYSHRDFSYQPYLAACLQALKWGTPPDGGNPYKHSRTQSAFATFGQPFLLALLATVTQSALYACWFQKWRVHRRLRPEEMGGWIAAAHRQEGGQTEAPSLPTGVLDSAAIRETESRFQSVLLPQAFPEGCPLHPAYPAGHAVIAGACVTVLKACFDESHEVPEPVIPKADGLALERYVGEPLSIGGELDKLASNVSMGRNFAGIHWRSDATAGLRLGEEVALRVLAEHALTGNEIFQGYSLRKFDGTRVTI